MDEALRLPNLVIFGAMKSLPAPVRRAGKLVFTRGGASYARKLDESGVPIPSDLLAEMWEDVARLESWLDLPLWSPDDDAVPSQQAEAR